jgi:hypothetical protein
MLNDAPVTIAVWNQLVRLVREPNHWRPGQLAWWIWLRFGTFVPKRVGPFRSEDDARQAFAALTAVLERTLKDAACDAANSAGCTFEEV